AATNQSRSVATDASLPRSSASLASTALLISSRWSSSDAAVAGRLEKSPPPVWLALAGAELRAKPGLSMLMLPMQPSVPTDPVRRPARCGFQKLRFVRPGLGDPAPPTIQLVSLQRHVVQNNG